MARIVKLDQVLPEDIVFEMPGGERFVAPGDPPLQLILTIAHLFEQAQGGNEDAGAVGIESLEKLDAEVLRLLRMRQPELDRSPFGVFGVQTFVTELLAAYQFGVEGEEEDPSGASETRPKAKTTPRSKRSTGSRSS